ncbi:MAG TPA: YbjN domain-containing protein [Micromonosporaceae bacterium]
MVSATVIPRQSGGITAITPERLADALDQLNVRYICDADGAFVAMWERHAVLVALEGPADDILVIRVRPHETVPLEWAQRAYEAVNEWNHARRFGKAYVGDANGLGRLPIFAELQMPFGAGVHPALLVDVLKCAVVESRYFVDWLHDGGALL